MHVFMKTPSPAHVPASNAFHPAPRRPSPHSARRLHQHVPVRSKRSPPASAPASIQQQPLPTSSKASFSTFETIKTNRPRFFPCRASSPLHAPGLTVVDAVVHTTNRAPRQYTLGSVDLTMSSDNGAPNPCHPFLHSIYTIVNFTCRMHLCLLATCQVIHPSVTSLHTYTLAHSRAIG